MWIVKRGVTVQEIAPIIAGNLQEERALLPAVGCGPGKPLRTSASNRRADCSHPALQQCPMWRHACAECHFEYHEAPSSIRGYIPCTPATICSLLHCGQDEESHCNHLFCTL